MSEFLSVATIIVIAIVTTALIVKHRKKKKRQKHRQPVRIDTATAINSTSYQSRRTPTSISTSMRTPRRTDDLEYMTYRNCPDCHSENHPGKQVIFQLEPHSFACTVCGHRFKF